MRLLGAVSVAAMAFGVLPISPVNAAIATTDACNASIPEDGFTDTGVDGTDVEDAVDCLVAYGITTGQSGTLYGTGGDVTRGQLATFVLNVLDQVDGFARPANAPDAFADDDGDTHEADINDAAALDLVKGFDDGTFGAGLPVQRDQMATYIINSLAEAGAPVAAATGDAFSDDDDSVHEGNINRLEAVDIVDGTVDGDYDPYRSVTRGTMAFFLTRTTEVLVDAALIAPFAVSNQTFTVDGEEAAVNTVGDERQYTVTNAATGETHTIALFPAEAVTVDADGIVTFADVEEDADGDVVGNNLADDIGNTPAEITVVNGTAVAADSQLVTVDPVGDTINFTVNSDDAVSVIPVVFFDADEDGQLDLDELNQPLEAELFGVGGEKTFLPEELATFGAVADGCVVDVNLVEDYYTLDSDGAVDHDNNPDTQEICTVDSVGLADVLVQSGTGETFRYTSAERDLGISFAQFEAWLSGTIVAAAGVVSPDTVSVSSYNPGAGTVHNITNDVPNAPTDLTAAYDATDDVVDIAFTSPTNPDQLVNLVVRVQLDENDEPMDERVVVCGFLFPVPGGELECDDDPNAPDGLAGAIANSADPAAGLTGPADSPYVAGNTYAYVAVAANAALQNGPTSAPAVVTIPEGADTTAPTLEGSTTTDSAPVGVLEAGDQIALDFDEAVVVENGDVLTFSDTSGTVGTVTLGGNATFTQNTAGDVVFITLTGNPIIETLGGDATLNGDVDLDEIDTFTDEAGNEFVLAAPLPIIVAGDTDTSAPTLVDADPNNGDVVTDLGQNLTADFDEAIATAATTLVCESRAVTGTTSIVDGNVVFNPLGDLPDLEECLVTYTVEDAAGNETVVPINFTTDANPPV